MVDENLMQTLLSLSNSERIEIAQMLWASIDWPIDELTRAEAIQRADELERGTVVGLTHEEVMKASRNAIRAGKH